MKQLLSGYPLLAEPIGRLAAGDATGAPAPPSNTLPAIRQFYLWAELFWRSRPTRRIAVKVLIDTGADLTLVAVEALQRLETGEGGLITELIPTERRICAAGIIKPTYDLALLLPGAQRAASSAYGFVCTQRNWGAGIDVLLGQDLLNQWIVTLDGVKGTLTISEPSGEAEHQA